MRILRVISSMDPVSGGPCQGIRNSVPALNKIGVYNEVVCLDSPDADFVGKDSFTIHVLGKGSGPWSYNAKLKPWLLDNLSSYDAVIIHGLWLYHGYAVKKAIEYLKKRGTYKIPKLFVMPHGMLDPYFQQADGRKLKALRNVLYWKLIEGRIINSSDGLLFTCKEEMQLARKTFSPYLPKKELNIGYGISAPAAFTADMKEAFTEICPQVGGKKYLLFLSRIHKKKAVDILLKAYAFIVEERQSKGLNIPVLVVAGPGIESGYGQEMQHYVESSAALKENVFFSGMLEGNAKWGAFYGCEAFILPSHQENFGIAVVEALACSKSVLLSDQVNIWREIKAHEAGLVAPDTLEGTIELLMNWFEMTPAAKEQMAIKARKCFEENFSIEPNALKLHNILSMELSDQR